MAWTATLVWVTGQLVTAAQMNTYLSADMDYLKGNAGAVAIGNSINATGAVTATTYIAAGPALSTVAGDISANRGTSSGYVFLGDTGVASCGFNGVTYQFPGYAMFVNGHRVVTEDEAEALTNKTSIAFNSVPAATGTVRFANGNQITWRDPGNGWDGYMTMDSSTRLSLGATTGGSWSTGGAVALSGNSADSLNVVINGVARKIPLI